MIGAVGNSVRAVTAILDRIGFKASTQSSSVSQPGQEISFEQQMARQREMIREQASMNLQMQEVSMESTKHKNMHDALMAVIRNSRVG